MHPTIAASLGLLVLLSSSMSLAQEPVPSQPVSQQPHPTTVVAEESQPALPQQYSVVDPRFVYESYPQAQSAPYQIHDASVDADRGKVETRSVWYGWQTLVADGAWMMTTIVGGSADSVTLTEIGLSGYLFAAPIVHWAHGNVGRGFGSLGLRLGTPVAFGLVGLAASSDCSGDFCELGGLALGVLLGAGTAIALDAAVLARETREQPRAVGIIRLGGVSMSPAIGVSDSQGTLQLQGVF